ncbi:MAG: YbaN family protein [Actinomycetota bacterium]|nr:YbaN family protein [Actinomycetota bacterium]
MGQPVRSDASRKSRNPFTRGVLFVLGMICLGLIPFSYLPGIPTFDLVLLAAFFFSMSSDTMHNWMLNHRYFGKIINGYRQHGLTTRMKWTATIGIVLSIAVSAIFLVDNTILRTIMGVVAIYAVWFVFSRPTRARDATGSAAALSDA